MKKIFFALFALFSMLLASCSVDEHAEDYEFTKKQKCEGYYDNIIKEWNGWYINQLSLKEIFYSSKMNTCLYVVRDDNSITIFDYLSKKEVFQLNGPFAWCWGITEMFTDKFKNCSSEIENKLSSKISELK